MTVRDKLAEVIGRTIGTTDWLDAGTPDAAAVADAILREWDLTPRRPNAEEARAELERLQRDRVFMKAFLDTEHPDHQQCVLRARALNRAALNVA